MSLFSSLPDFISFPESDSIGDDNVGVSSEQNNSFISAPVLGMRTAYDSMHLGFSYLIKGKKTALSQLDKYIKKWTSTLDGIVKRYEGMLAKIDELSSDVSGALTLDFAKEAWEILQDTPILRRYLGEANYWALYDTLGILSVQSGEISVSTLATLKGAVKKTILAVISSTDGLISIQSYVSYLQNSWGFLYVKCLDPNAVDSVLPQVTTAYWYKPALPSMSLGEQHAFTLQNSPPGVGFSAVPFPIPREEMVAIDLGYVKKFDYKNPDTWYLNGVPYYKQGTMDMLHRALSYWSSSYTNSKGIANAVYLRNNYAGEGSNPLQVGKFLEQLDVSKMSVGGSFGGSTLSGSKEILESVFTPNLLSVMQEWQTEYEAAYNDIVQWIFDVIGTTNTPPTTIASFITDNPKAYGEWYNGSSESIISFKQHTQNMYDLWHKMLGAYSVDNGIALDNVTFNTVFDAVMTAIKDASRASTGYEYSLKKDEIYIVAPSFDPITETDKDEMLTYRIGVPYTAYKVKPSKAKVVEVIQQLAEINAVQVEIPVTHTEFVMFPSMDVEFQTMFNSCVRTKQVAGSILTGVVDVPDGVAVGDSITEGNVVEYVFGFGKHIENERLGAFPEALCLHRAGGLYKAKFLTDNSKSSGYTACIGTYFFPDGKLPESRETAVPYPTFYTVYKSYLEESGQDSINELADVVGYSINHGREPKFPCLGVYGNLLSMASWNYAEMLNKEFLDTYAPIKSGSRLYYKIENPAEVVLYHSSYQSAARNMKIAVYHEYVASETRAYGSDSFDYYVFPGESVAVYKIPPEGKSLGTLLSVHAISPIGEMYHYAVNKNPIPLVPKYIDPTEWSFVDVVYEMLLLSHSLAGLCGDNGKRQIQLEADLKDFEVSVPEFVGELPDNNGITADFKLGVMDTFASKIETAVNAVYECREKLITATESL